MPLTVMNQPINIGESDEEHVSHTLFVGENADSSELDDF
jgi:hypothetical protein